MVGGAEALSRELNVVFVQRVHGLAPAMTMMGSAFRDRRAGPMRLSGVFLILKKSTS